MQHLVTKKYHATSWAKKNSHNLAGQKIMQPLGTKNKSHATPRDKKRMQSLGTKKSRNLLGPKKSRNLSGQKINATSQDPKIMQPLGTKIGMQPLGTKKSCNQSQFFGGHFEFVTVYLGLVKIYNQRDIF